jgi:glycosyltransferase involved in cell wall biosynthesis
MKILILNQAFYPDVVATAQHATDLALRLAQGGHEVSVVAGCRGYDNQGLKFPARETLKGVRIRRVRALALGKKSKWRRALNFASFMLGCAFRLLATPRQDVVIALTSPPLISYLATLFVQLKGGRLVFWVMDLNPDEAIAAGWLREDSLAAKSLSALLRRSLKASAKIVVLDRFMKRRVLDKGARETDIAVIPPWSHDEAVRYDGEGRRRFRAQHGLTDKFVVMYSGNHSPCHPLDTLLEAALHLADQPHIVFCFVGGGSEFKKVEDWMHTHQLANIVCLPYQPLDGLSASLSSADLHAVVMGDRFAGLVHPCKIYNILTVGKPFLYIGPPESHVIDIAAEIAADHKPMLVRHGDAEAVSHYIAAKAEVKASPQPPDQLVIAEQFSMAVLLPRMIDCLESLNGDRALYDSQTPEVSN